LAFSLQANRPGALLAALTCFASEGLNMSRIESRPSKRSMGEYIFFVDLDLSQGVEPLDRAMAALKPHCEQLVLFGVYPLTVLNQPEDNNNAANN
jgi:prephenate dehydratase